MYRFYFCVVVEEKVDVPMRTTSRAGTCTNLVANNNCGVSVYIGGRENASCLWGAFS